MLECSGLSVPCLSPEPGSSRSHDYQFEKQVKRAQECRHLQDKLVGDHAPAGPDTQAPRAQNRFYSSPAENRSTKSGFSFANGDCVTHMRQGLPLQRLFAAPLRSICPAALTASSRAASRSGSSTPTWSISV